MLRHPLLDKVASRFTSFIHNSYLFGNKSGDLVESELEENIYFEEIEMSSYLRQFKKLGAIADFYGLVQRHVLAPKLDQLARNAYQEKGGALKLMAGEADAKLPLKVYLDGVQKHLLDESLKGLIKLTTE